MDSSGAHIVVIGASAGGVPALIELAKRLPRNFPAPICVVQHIGGHPSMLPELLRFHGSNHAMHPEDGQRLLPGVVHVAPPDHHMLVEGSHVRLVRGPKENHARPAIDPLFRSAALGWGERTIGVVLTGQLDDGTAGLGAIKDCGGIAIVQDPATAAEPDMPRSALLNVEVDHCVPLEQLAPLLERLVATRSGVHKPPPEQLVREVAINRGDGNIENLSAIADPSPLTCPDCGGSLWEVRNEKPLRYRCHVGHAYSMMSLSHAQAEAAEAALWSSVRALREREMLLRRFANLAQATGDTVQAKAGQAQADRVLQQIREVTEAAERSLHVLDPETQT